MNRFSDCLAFVLKWEGGFVNDPADPGGATNKGITQAVYDDWRAGRKLPLRTVRAITAAEIEAIYRARYWDACRCGNLPAPVDLVVFDSAVNCGVSRARSWLQEAAGVVPDGAIGPKTLAAVAAFKPVELARQVAARRDGHYQAIVKANPALAKFAKGWGNRMGSLKEAIV